MEAIATVNLAHPNGGPPLPYGTPVQVDEGDPYTKAHLDAGMIVPVSGGQATQVWDENAPTINTGRASDLSFERPVAAADQDTADKSQPRSAATKK